MEKVLFDFVFKIAIITITIIIICFVYEVIFVGQFYEFQSKKLSLDFKIHTGWSFYLSEHIFRQTNNLHFRQIRQLQLNLNHKTWSNNNSNKISINFKHS